MTLNIQIRANIVKKRGFAGEVVVWSNILLQLFTPVITTLTPALTLAMSTSQAHASLLATETQPYTLTQGETVASVAARLHVSVGELEKTNQFRSFSKPFTSIGAGDEIDIPRTEPSSPVDVPPLGAVQDTSSGERDVAQVTTQVAGALQSGDPSAVAVDRIRGLASNKATQEIQDWLKGYGTARIKLGVDDHMNLEGSELDLLLPLHDTPSQLTYTQMGMRHIDKRTTANIGVGQRHFLGEQMVGYNAFFDHDITGDHSRGGIGAEYWRDYLKLGANGYFRLSGWKNANNLDGYEARPANGFDINAEGYLPGYPQLGGKLRYEQYFGDEVGLFGYDNRQKDPGAVTVGVNYTPFPLLTVGIDRRQGTHSGGETVANLDLRYEIGTPWAKQVDTGAVGTLRSLAGSRYDLVERNNQIVLEYRKIITLSMLPSLNGQPGDIKSLGVHVKAPYGLSEIKWDAASLLGNGGEIIETSPGQYSVKLPQWQANNPNHYTITAQAFDKKGNASERISTEITLDGNASGSQAAFIRGYLIKNGVVTPVYEKTRSLRAAATESNSPSLPSLSENPLDAVPTEGSTVTELADFGNILYLDENMSSDDYIDTNPGDPNKNYGHLPNGKVGKKYIELLESNRVSEGFYDPDTKELYPMVFWDADRDLFSGTQVKRETRYKLISKDSANVAATYKFSQGITSGVATTNLFEFTSTLGWKISAKIGGSVIPAEVTAEFSLNLSGKYGHTVTVTDTKTQSREFGFSAANNPAYKYDIYVVAVYQLESTYTVIPGPALRASGLKLAAKMYTYKNEETYATVTPYSHISKTNNG
ncbi:inverse autotransporter beta domain-containing protein [Serratia marcescens]|uniref:inverse autotransporter beta domain-containing protein n=1 Tax=Serratia marcescens TaxID=615 RepID=UPI00217C3A34|nr:inverse autotransporter beta domain-containing protein [Serratia marcescens]CAI1117721.1 Attaching and effacing protein [Serratia marcescens]